MNERPKFMQKTLKGKFKTLGCKKINMTGSIKMTLQKNQDLKRKDSTES